MTADPNAAAGHGLPQLNHRLAGTHEYEPFSAPTMLIGHITALDQDYVRIAQGPALEIEIDPLDLLPVFGEDDLEATYAILLDAAANKDLVKIKLAASHITYENEAQERRYAALAKT